MKFATTLFIITISLAVSAFSQTDNEKQIKEIRDFYNKLGAEITRIESSPEAANQSFLAVNELVVNKLDKSWPAVGTYKEIYRFYYKQVGETHYPEHLSKVTVSTTSAAREYYKEYVFNDDGELIFAFLKDPEGFEDRVYFDNGKSIGYTRKYQGKPPTNLQTVSHPGPSQEAARLQKLFKLSLQ